MLPGSEQSTSSRAWRSICPLAGGRLGAPAIIRSRQSTRSTFPSMAGTGRPKAKLESGQKQLPVPVDYSVRDSGVSVIAIEAKAPRRTFRQSVLVDMLGTCSLLQRRVPEVWLITPHGWEAGLEKGRFRTTLGFAWKRAGQLARPALALAFGWWLIGSIGVALYELDGVPRAVRLILSPLWFILVYLLLIALFPVTHWLHERYGALVIVWGVGLAVLLDLSLIHISEPTRPY